jgi:hypothetical protein
MEGKANCRSHVQQGLVGSQLMSAQKIAEEAGKTKCKRTLEETILEQYRDFSEVFYKAESNWFRMTNFLVTFPGSMNSIFLDLIAAGTVAVYLDNILILTDTQEEHW